MELLQLRYFLESAKNGNFAKTAEKHWVPASSVSASVKRLEQELGCRLFDRESNRIILNENGKKLQSTLGAILDELDRTVEELKQPESPDTEIKILILTLRERAINAIVEYQRQHPTVRFSTTFNVRDANPADYDLIIDQKNDRYADCEKHELCSFQLCFKCPKDSPLVGRRLTLKDLRHMPLITMDTENELNSVLFEGCKRADFYPNIIMRTNDSLCYKRCSQAGIGIGLWRKNDSPKEEELAYLSVEDFQPRQTMYLYYRHKRMSAQLGEFIDFLKRWDF